MVCSHRIVATRTVLGLWENRGADRRPGKVASVLRLTIGPLVVYSLIDAAIAGVLAAYVAMVVTTGLGINPVLSIVIVVIPLRASETTSGQAWSVGLVSR